MPLKQAAAIRHVPFEDLGTIEPILRDAGYAPRYLDAGIGDPAAAESADLVIVLGGPIGAYEEMAYPFLTAELALIARHIDAGRPTLGLCLGAQLMARAMGARVYPMGVREIGWGPVDIHDAARATPLRHLDGLAMLHWHGDTFDLPAGCDLLASTAICRNQAFARGPDLLALQFHPEVDAANLERWLIGHACELAAAGLDPAALRAGAQSSAPALRAASDALFTEWLEDLC